MTKKRKSSQAQMKDEGEKPDAGKVVRVDSDMQKSMFKNKEKVLLVSSRGITFRYDILSDYCV